MQEYSKIRSFLIQRENNRLVLPSEKIVAGQTNVEWVLLPVIAYDVCLTTTINSHSKNSHGKF